MKTKEKLIIVLLSIVIAGISYWFFWDGYYSIDTYRIISQGYTDYALKDAYIRDGRLFLAGIVSLVGIINPSYKVWYIINLAIAIFISAITVLQLYMIINHYKKAKNTKNKCIYFLVSFLFIFNFVQIDTMQFIEAFAIATSILLYILSLKNTVINKNKKMGFIYAILGMLWYQGTVTIYIATAFLMCLLENKKINKEFFKKILSPAIIIIISAILSSLIVSIVPYITKLELTERFPSVEKYMNILKRNIMQMDNLLIDCCGYFPKYIFISASLLILIVIFVYGIKHKNITQPINALIVFYIYIVSIFIFFPIQSIELCFRCALSLGAAIPALFIYMICNMEMLEGKKIYLNILTIMVILYFILSVCNTVKVTSEFKFANELDERFVKRIETEAKNLQDQGINVQKYAVYYTTNGDRLNELYNSEITFYNSYYLLSRDFNNMFGIYGDKNVKLDKQFADKEIVDKYFENPSEEEIQIKYINNILYVVVDL
jgi:hypothetical protein